MTSRKMRTEELIKNSTLFSTEKQGKCVKGFLPELAQIDKTVVSYQELTAIISFLRKHSPQTPNVARVTKSPC